ncbi:hypothetical protein BCR33DRAFT_710996 [Rhizoclosmatium globosum]|uniref:Transmembrane protein n=1 Tax=Rhizoclosmatium globosum TaxID=329046 RepID=A0A1Y2D318_9FUNG|nr:hypothetical protein BCR33DRAFT_710996 [Rhizoclosmatium globosum]|eukprot:ORY53607.1 hypothetical protein BCR33DRAFT_710996 [Rhizoclosmatium globosum]
MDTPLINNGTQVFVPSTISNSIQLLIMGMVLEVNARGLISTYTNIKSRTGCMTVLVLMLAGNVFSVLLVWAGSWILFVGQDKCNQVSVFLTFAWNLFFCTFDAFLLFKTSRVCRHARWFLLLAWAAYDLSLAQGLWNEGLNLCLILDDLTSGTGVLISDIFAIYLVLTLQKAETEPNKLYQVLCRENLLRTVFVSLAHTIVVVALISDGWWLQIASATSSYMFVQSLNSEFFWRKARADAITDGK